MVANDEQVMLRDAAAGWLRERAPVSALRALREKANGKGFDGDLWQDMAAMGWAGIVVPEGDGGFGFGHVGMGLVAQEMGRSLVASPLIDSAVLGAGALVLGGSAAQKESWLPRLVSGEIHAALALEETAFHAPERTALNAAPSGTEWVLSGIKRPVAEAQGAGLLVVAARTSGAAGDEAGITLFLCPGDAAGLSITPLRQIDSRGAAIVEFSGVRLGAEAVLGEVGAGFALLDALLDRGRAVLAAEMLGGALQAFETTVEYLRTRVQFDKPIGSFQALQHRAADMLADIEATRSAVEAALMAIDAGDADSPRLASLAKALAGKCYRRVSQEMIQLHGGIGMTDEHDAGLYFKRAQASDMALGNVSFHRARYARLSGF